jgi:hypothetical protein
MGLTLSIAHMTLESDAVPRPFRGGVGSPVGSGLLLHRDHVSGGPPVHQEATRDHKAESGPNASEQNIVDGTHSTDTKYPLRELNPNTRASASNKSRAPGCCRYPAAEHYKPDSKRSEQKTIPHNLLKGDMPCHGIGQRVANLRKGHEIEVAIPQDIVCIEPPWTRPQRHGKQSQRPDGEERDRGPTTACRSKPSPGRDGDYQEASANDPERKKGAKRAPDTEHVVRLAVLVISSTDMSPCPSQSQSSRLWPY